MLCYQFTIGVANDVVDIDEDRTAKPWKPVASGAIPRTAAVFLAAVLAGLGLLVTSTLGLRPWAVGACGLVLGLAYDLGLKRTALSFVPYALAIPLIPVWVLVSAGRGGGDSWTILPLGALLGVGLHLANQAQDVEEGHGPGLPALLGARDSRALAVALFVAVTGAACLLLLARGGATSALVVAGVGLLSSAAALATAAGRRHSFEVLAIGGSILGTLYLHALAGPR